MKKIIIVAVVLVLVGLAVAGIVAYYHRDEIAGYALTKGTELMETALAESISDQALLSNVRTELATIKEKLATGSVDLDRLRATVNTFYASYSDKKLDSLEVKRLLDQLHTLVVER